ncbi:sugar transferase [Sphingomonas sp. PL20]|uniref:sugar transferase n=1 Tax=Sphingomonas sp. PL20 TaxID=2760712 RepID=UPI001AE3317B
MQLAELNLDWAANASPKAQRDWFRPVDLTVAVLAILFFAPLMGVITLAIMATGKGPIIFAHRRLGLDGREFRCFKFRTMVVDAEARLNALLASDPAARAEWQIDHKLRCDPRITPIGSFLRRTSFDELPQLFNVLLNDMSIVGPRPIVRAEVARYGRWFADYSNVKPGITGLWQVSGRNNTTYRRRVALDVVYSRRRTLRLNSKILLMTLPAVLTQRGSF